LEVVGEEVAVRQSPPTGGSAADIVQTLFQRQPTPMTVK
jgi:hypothetical protein